MQRLLLLSVAMLLFLSPLHAQIVPPSLKVHLIALNPSPYVGDWESSPGIAMMTVQNTTAGSVDVNVTATLWKDGTKIGSAQSNITSVKNGISTFPSSQIAPWSELSFNSNIQNAINKTGRLPDGLYELHVKVSQTTVLRAGLSDSTYISFFLSYPQPPQLIAPIDQSDVSFPNPTFQWTPVITTGILKIKYKLKIVEILQGQTPKQAIDANVPSYEETVSGSTSKLYPPSALPLEKGKKYAWQVQALGFTPDRVGDEKPIGANNGKSEIWRFTYPKALTFTAAPMVVAKKEKQKSPTQYQFPYNTFVKGKLLYCYPSINGWAIPSSPSYPLKNTPVKLMQKLAILEKKSGQMMIIPTTVWDKVLAVTTTDENGQYMFMCVMTDSMKLLFKNRTWTINGNSVSGDLYRVGSIEVDNPYYCSPDSAIMVQAGETKILNPITTKARSYVLSLKVMPNTYQQQAQLTTGPLSGIIVYLLRKTHPIDAPLNEGYNHPVPAETKFGMEVVSKDTTDNGGRVNLIYLTKNIGPNDTYYIHAEPDPKGDKNYIFWGPIEYQFGYTGDKAKYSSAYSAAMDFKTIHMHPFLPKVEGNIYRADNPTKPVWGAKVKLLKFAILYWDLEKSMTSFWNGMFKFPDLPMVYDNADNVVGPMRGMKISMYGFRDTSLAINNGDPLKLGQKVYFEKILLQPAAQVHGYVADEEGHGIKAKVTIGDGATVDANPAFTVNKNSSGYSVMTGNATPAYFECPAVIGAQKIIIDPVDKSYFTDTISINITQPDQDLKTFTLKKKMQRIQVWVYPEVTQQFVGPPKGIRGAVVKIQNVNPPLGSETNESGSAEFKFTSSGNQFSVKVSPPANLDFEGKTISVTAPPSKEWSVVTVYLKKAAKVSGKVFAGQNAAVEGARVFLDQSSSSGTIEAKTGANGSYILRNVPLGKQTLRAVKGGNNIGESVQLNITENGIYIVKRASGYSAVKTPPVDSVNFHLKVYEDMDITNLLGFPIEVTQLTKVGNEVKINGIFSHLPSNNVFAPDTSFDCKPSFSVVIVPSTNNNKDGVPFAAPKGGSITIDRHEIDLKIYQKLIGKSEDKNLLKIQDNGQGIGVMNAKVIVSANSFNDPNVKFKENGFYLALPAISDPAKRMLIPSITGSGSLPVDVTNGFLSVSQSGGSIQYELYGPNGFTVKTDSSKSFLKDGAVRLASILHTQFQNITPSDINLDLGDVVLHTDKLDPIKGTKKISIPLENWSLESENWSLSKFGGFKLNGILKTGKVDVPFTGLEIKPTQFISTANTFQLNEMSLSGIVPLTVTGDPYFGYDAGQKHWSLSIAPKSGQSSSAFFADLPGMKNGEKIIINNFFILSNGDNGFTIDQNMPPLTLYNVATFKATMMNVYDTYIHIPGTMDVHIPNVVGQSTAIDFKKNSQGNLAMSFQAFPFGFTTNGVALTFLASGEYPEALDNNGFISRGTVEEQGKFKFNVMLYKTTDSISIWVEPNQELNIAASGSSKFTKIAGTMRVDNNAWSNFSFAGDLAGTEGASGRITFTVIGDITANQQEVGLQNIQTPFGNIALVYDFENHRLIGTVDFSQGIDVGGATVKGTAEVLFSDDGYYILACGTLGIAGFKGQVGMLFGNYPVTPSITEKFKQYSWIYQHKGAFPPSFPTHVKGFFIEGEAQIPVIIPDIEFDYILISGRLYVHVGADMRLAMNFYETASIGIGATVFGEAGVSLGGSIGIACAGVSASVLVDVGFDGLLYKNGNYLVTGDIGLNLCGSAYCGWGLCDSDCDGKFCDKSEEGGCKGIGVRATLSNADKNFEFYLK